MSSSPHTNLCCLKCAICRFFIGQVQISTFSLFLGCCASSFSLLHLGHDNCLSLEVSFLWCLLVKVSCSENCFMYWILSLLPYGGHLTCSSGTYMSSLYFNYGLNFIWMIFNVNSSHSVNSVLDCVTFSDAEWFRWWQSGPSLCSLIHSPPGDSIWRCHCPAVTTTTVWRIAKW
jgi:hypothetical protein